MLNALMPTPPVWEAADSIKRQAEVDKDSLNQ